MTRYSIKPKTRKYVQGYGFLSFTRNLSNKCVKTLLDTATKTRLVDAKTDFKKVAHKTAEATGELIGNKFAEKIVPDENYRNVEERDILPGKRKEILN